MKRERSNQQKQFHAINSAMDDSIKNTVLRSQTKCISCMANYTSELSSDRKVL